MFQGYVELEATIKIPFLTRAGDEPLNASALPTYRVYGPDGLMTNGTGSAAFKDSGAISGATNASPIVVTDTAHGLKTGDKVTITGVLGNTAANGTWTVTRVSADTYSLDGSTGNGSYSSGGTWNIVGLYTLSVAAAAADDYDSGCTYTVVVQAVVDGDNWSQSFTFIVV